MQLFLVVLLLAYPAWVRGGTKAYLHEPALLIGGLLMLCVFLAPALCGQRGSASMEDRPSATRSLRDPILYLGAAFLAVLLAQWWNAGRSLVFDQAAGKWLYSPPRIAWLPSAVKASEAREMVSWFFPALSLAVALRSGVFQKGSTHLLFLLMCLNGGLLALFGIVQYASGTHAIYWTTPLDCAFFASFGYISHAAAFFVLMFSVACGLVLGGFFSPYLRASRARLAGLIVCALLCLAAVHLSLALAPVVLVWAIAAGTACHALVLTWQRLRPASRVYVVLGVVMVCCVGYLLVALLYGLSPGRVREGFSEIGQSNVLAQKFEERAFLVQPAWAIWKDHPWFGVGGWGYRYFLGMYLEPGRWDQLKPGYANVHNDPIQFLAEFGLVGAGLMASIVVVLLAGAYRSGAWRRPVAFVPVLGTLVLLAYSLTDLPFRCPAILYSWVAVLAATPGFMVSGRMLEKLEST